MKFFKPEDFYRDHSYPVYVTYQDMADIANTKLEKEGKVLYGVITNGEYSEPDFIARYSTKPKFFHCDDNEVGIFIRTSLLQKCDHPNEKVKYGRASECWFCICGAKVEPAYFKEK